MADKIFRMNLTMYSIGELDVSLRTSFGFVGSPYKATDLESDLIKYFTDKGIWYYLDGFHAPPQALVFPLHGRQFAKEQDFRAYWHMVTVHANNRTGVVEVADWMSSTGYSEIYNDRKAWLCWNVPVRIDQVTPNGIRRYSPKHRKPDPNNVLMGSLGNVAANTKFSKKKFTLGEE